MHIYALLCYQLLIMHAICATGQVISVTPRSSSVSYANSLWLCLHVLCYQLLTMHAIYATGQVIFVIPRSSSVSHANSLWFCLHVHVIMHIYAMWSVSDYACYAMLPAFNYACYLCNWIGYICDSQIQLSQLCKQLVVMLACVCDYAHLFHAMLPAFNYACYLCNWIGHICDSQIQLSQLCKQLVAMPACACDYAHLCYVVSFRLCLPSMQLAQILLCRPIATYMNT